MKVKDIMTERVIRIAPEETAQVAARTLAHYNIGALPVCTAEGHLCGMVTDRDLAVRCMASEHPAERTRVREVMTSQVVSISPDAEAEAAARVMGRRQLRRLPVVEDGKLCGILSLADLAGRAENSGNAMEALSGISSGVSSRDMG